MRRSVGNLHIDILADETFITGKIHNAQALGTARELGIALFRLQQGDGGHDGARAGGERFAQVLFCF